MHRAYLKKNELEEKENRSPRGMKKERNSLSGKNDLNAKRPSHKTPSKKQQDTVIELEEQLVFLFSKLNEQSEVISSLEQKQTVLMNLNEQKEARICDLEGHLKEYQVSLRQRDVELENIFAQQGCNDSNKDKYEQHLREKDLLICALQKQITGPDPSAALNEDRESLMRRIVKLEQTNKTLVAEIYKIIDHCEHKSQDAIRRCRSGTPPFASTSRSRKENNRFLDSPGEKSAAVTASPRRQSTSPAHICNKIASSLSPKSNMLPGSALLASPTPSSTPSPCTRKRSSSPKLASISESRNTEGLEQSQLDTTLASLDTAENDCINEVQQRYQETICHAEQHHRLHLESLVRAQQAQVAVVQENGGTLQDLTQAHQTDMGVLVAAHQASLCALEKEKQLELQAIEGKFQRRRLAVREKRRQETPPVERHIEPEANPSEEEVKELRTSVKTLHDKLASFETRECQIQYLKNVIMKTVDSENQQTEDLQKSLANVISSVLRLSERETAVLTKACQQGFLNGHTTSGWRLPF